MWGASKSHPGTGRTPDLGTTQRYMHLSPAALDAAIRLLETGTHTSRNGRGEIVEAAGTEGPKAHIH